MESKEERLLRAIFGNEPQAEEIKFFMNLDNLTVDVSIRRNKKTKVKLANALYDVSVEAKDNDSTKTFKTVQFKLLITDIKCTYWSADKFLD